MIARARGGQSAKSGRYTVLFSAVARPAAAGVSDLQ
jgi:hypothetical protein